MSSLERSQNLINSRLSSAANSIASEETIQELMDGAEVVLAARSAKRKKVEERRRRNAEGLTDADKAKLQEDSKYGRIDPRTIGLGESDLATDEITAAFGQDQSDFQNSRANDKSFSRDKRRDSNVVTYYDPETETQQTVTLKDGQGLRALERSGQYTAEQIDAIEKGITGAAYGGISDETRPRRRDFKTGEDIPIDPTLADPAGMARIRAAKLQRQEGSSRPQLFYPEMAGDYRPISAEGAREMGVETVKKFQEGVIDEDGNLVRKEPGEPKARSAVSGAGASKDALARIEASIAAGEITVDTPLPKGGTVGDLMTKLRGTTDGRVLRDADRASGAMEVERNRRYAAGDLTPEEATREARKISVMQGLAPGSLAAGREESGSSKKDVQDYVEIKGQRYQDPIAQVRAMQGVEGAGSSTSPGISGTGAGGAIQRGREVYGDDVLLNLDGQIGEVVERRIANDAEAAASGAAAEIRNRRTRRTLDGLPTLIPGKYAYVRDEGSENARAMTLQDGTFLVDGGNTANVDGMQRVKLNDYRTVNPDDPSTWQASEMPEAERRVGYDGIRYVDAGGADLGDSTVQYNPNTPDTGNMLNVGEAPNTVQDLAALEIKKRQSAERMRQVGINPSLDRVAEALGRIPGMEGVSPPRSLAELQNMVDYAQKRGGQFHEFDPANPGSSKKTSTPTARDILASRQVGLSPDEIGNAMQALVMADAARDTQMPVDAGSMARANHATKEGFYTGANRGVVPGVNPGANNVAGVIRTIPDNKDVYGVDPYADPAVMGRNALHHIGSMDGSDRVAMGVDSNGEPNRLKIGPMLRNLTGETMNDLDNSERADLLQMAQSLQQGTFADEGSPDVVKGPIDRRSREAIIREAQAKYEGWGKPNDTRGILQSANRGLQMEAQIRQTDAQIQAGQAAAAEASSQVDQSLRAERLKRDEQIARGNDVSAARDRGERARVGGQAIRAYADINTREPLRIAAVPGDTPTRPNVQPIEQAPVQASIAPDPWAATGSQPAPAVDAGGRFGGGGGKPPKAPAGGAYEGPTRRLDDNLKAQLAALNSGQPQEPPSAASESAYAAPDSRPAGDLTSERAYEAPVSNEMRNKIVKRGRMGARGRQIATGGGIGLGALAAGLGLKGITRTEDDQEQAR